LLQRAQRGKICRVPLSQQLGVGPVFMRVCAPIPGLGDCA
jgi:hypothetical protein